MNEHSEIILEKMIDHFGEWEEPVKKTSLKLKKTGTKHLEKVKKKPRVRLETQSEKERKEEILIFKEELRSLNNQQISQTKTSRDAYAKTRQAELIYTKEVIRAAISRNMFTLAS